MSQQTAGRRVGQIARHLEAEASPADLGDQRFSLVSAQPASSSYERLDKRLACTSLVRQPACRVVAEHTGVCRRIHGRVSREPAAWQSVERVGGDLLQEVLYSKAEGIARVRGTDPVT